MTLRGIRSLPLIKHVGRVDRRFGEGV